MHAILGYSASELMATTDPSLAEAAMTHRLKAIKAIQRALSTTPITPNCKPPSAPSITSDLYEEGNALMATCFALTYQSVLLADGMAEYMTFIRGIVLVAIGMYCKGAKMLFGEMLGEKQYVNSSSLFPLSAPSGAVRSTIAPELLPSLPKQEVIY